MKCFSLFSGVGGFELGLPKDWDIIGFSEIDKYASQVLKYRFPKVKNYGDCQKINYEQLPDFDILTGGSPCQDFSIAGKRRGLSGSRSSLAWEFIRCLRDKTPRYFIWENVKGVLSSRGGWDFANLLTTFSESGYSLWWQVLNAKNFGVPQNRERIFVVGFREGSPPEVFFERETDEKFNAEQMSSQKHPFVIQKVGNKNPSGKGMSGGVYSDKGIFPTIGAGGGREDKNRKRDTGWSSGYLESKNKIRKLMPSECEALMSWSDNWTKWGIDEKGNKVEISDSQRYKMCGNGVVSNCVKFLMENVICG